MTNLSPIPLRCFSIYLSRSAETRSREAASLGGAERGSPNKCTATRDEAEGMSAFARNGTFFGDLLADDGAGPVRFGTNRHGKKPEECGHLA